MEDRELVALMSAILYAGIHIRPTATSKGYDKERAVEDAHTLLEIVSTQPRPIKTA